MNSDVSRQSNWFDLSQEDRPNICHKCLHYHIMVREDKDGNLVEHPELSHGTCGQQINEWSQKEKIVFAWAQEACFVEIQV